MYKITVETKSRSKHVFTDIDEEGKNQLQCVMHGRGFSGMSFLKIKTTYFNPENIASVKIEESNNE